MRRHSTRLTAPAPSATGRAGRVLAALALALLVAPPPAQAEAPQLVMERVAADTYAFIGEQTSFVPENGGNMMNAGFIVTDRGVVVIDTGLTRKIAEAMLAHIREVTDAPLHLAINTHFHPDHTFGNAAFAERGVPILATPAARAQLAAEGPRLLENIKALVAPWAEHTTLALPERMVEANTVLELGNHRLELLIFDPAHTRSDLVVFDRTTGVLFAGDLVFHQSAPATPNADLEGWARAVERLKALPWSVLVPGHGPPIREPAELDELRDYLVWLPEAIEASVMSGDDINDLLARPIPAPFDRLALVEWQFQRSVLRFFPEAEMRMFEGQ